MVQLPHGFTQMNSPIWATENWANFNVRWFVDSEIWCTVSETLSETSSPPWYQSGCFTLSLHAMPYSRPVTRLISLYSLNEKGNTGLWGVLRATAWKYSQNNSNGIKESMCKHQKQSLPVQGHPSWQKDSWRKSTSHVPIKQKQPFAIVVVNNFFVEYVSEMVLYDGTDVFSFKVGCYLFTITRSRCIDNYCLAFDWHTGIVYDNQIWMNFMFCLYSVPSHLQIIYDWINYRSKLHMHART